MILQLHRTSHSKYGTFGVLTVNNEHPIYTLEETELEIPQGTYSVEITYSPHFKRLLPLILVPHRQGIRFHEGNYPRDSSGCILTGLYKNQNMLLGSRAALDPLVIQIQETLAAHAAVQLVVSEAS